MTYVSVDMECYWTVNLITLTSTPRRSIWRLLFNNTPCPPQLLQTMTYPGSHRTTQTSDCKSGDAVPLLLKRCRELSQRLRYLLTSGDAKSQHTPQVFDHIKILWFWRTRKNVDALLTQEVLYQPCCMWTGVIMLENHRTTFMSQLWDQLWAQDFINITSGGQITVNYQHTGRKITVDCTPDHYTSST